jgi:hypothetical protein
MKPHFKLFLPVLIFTAGNLSVALLALTQCLGLWPSIGFSSWPSVGLLAVVWLAAGFAYRMVKPPNVAAVPLAERRANPARRGLAMLELTLTLPILLFVMALMVNFGTMCVWKVREHSVARLQVWETRWPRTGATDQRPTYWPASATMSASDTGNVSGMEDRRVEQPVARGPLQGATVDENLLDPTRGLRLGEAEYTHKYPMLSKITKAGTYTIDSKDWLVDDKWQYQRMNLSDTYQRRIPVIYTLAKASTSLVNSYVQSAIAIVRAPFAAQLRPLDNDPDYIYYSSIFHWGGPPDFHPRFPIMCTTDRDLTDKVVENLIKRIQGGREGRRHIPSVAEVMAQSFLGLFERALGAFEAIVKATKPPAPPRLQAFARTQIPPLKAKVAGMQDAQKKIRASSGN